MMQDQHVVDIIPPKLSVHLFDNKTGVDFRSSEKRFETPLLKLNQSEDITVYAEFSIKNIKEPISVQASIKGRPLDVRKTFLFQELLGGIPEGISEPPMYSFDLTPFRFQGKFDVVMKLSFDELGTFEVTVPIRILSSVDERL